VSIHTNLKVHFNFKSTPSKHRESIKLNLAGIEAIKKQIGKEMELYKKLELFKRRLSDDTSRDENVRSTV